MARSPNDAVGHPPTDRGSPPDDFSEHTRLGRDFLGEVDGLEEAVRGLSDPMWLVSQHAVGGPQPLVWLGALVNQLVNELTDLTNDAVCGRGRPAAKAARTLFELLVTAKDITTGPWSMADRYERHRWVVWRDLADLNDRTRRGSLSRQEAHHRKVSRREVDRNAAEAVNIYGPSFRAKWHPQTLYDRAKSHGLGDDYQWYRLASAVLHGAAGGVLGNYVEFRDGPTLYRSGAAIGLAPDALAYGLRWARMAFEALTRALGPVTELMTAAIIRVETFVPRFEEAIRDYDSQLWRSLETTDLHAVLVVTRWGKWQWYIQAGRTEWVRPALEPESLTDKQREMLEQFIEQSFASPDVTGDCVSIWVETDRRVYPVAGKGWQFSPQIFQYPGLRWDEPSQPRGYELRPVENE